MHGWLRIESLVSLTALLTVYAKISGDWNMFCWFFLLPDLSLLAFLCGARIGSVTYNIAHSLTGPAALVVLSFVWAGHGSMMAIALIWLIHIHMDRTIDYGLKQIGSFRATHLGLIGRSGGSITEA